MLPFLYVLLVIAFIVVLLTLIMGGRALTRSGGTDREVSNTWMRRRIFAQGFALGLLVLILLVKKNSG